MEVTPVLVAEVEVVVLLQAPNLCLQAAVAAAEAVEVLPEIPVVLEIPVLLQTQLLIIV